MSSHQSLSFFAEKKYSKVVSVGKGPSQKEQLNALINNNHWTVLNASLFNCGEVKADCDLRLRVNAFKHLLQVHGSRSDKLPDFRRNTGGASGHIFHGHVKDSQGTTFVIEWSVIDTVNKRIAITRFDKHENFSFKQGPLKANEIQAILNDPFNIKIMDNVEKNKKIVLKKYDDIVKKHGNLP